MTSVKKFLVLLFVLLGLSLIYTSSLIGVDRTARAYLLELKQELREQGNSPNFFVFSGKRIKLHNDLLHHFGGAASQSRHLLGQAIDLIILDINGDGTSDGQDVDIVYDLLDKKIIRDNGGIGVYKNERGFFNRQMLHLDCRGTRARWSR